MTKHSLKTLAAVCLTLFVKAALAQTSLAWAKQLKGDEYESPQGIAVDKSGNVYTVGTIYAKVDMDPGAGTFYLDATNSNPSMYLNKLDVNGDFVWARMLTSTQMSTASAMVMDKYGNIFISGFFSGTADFDMGSDTHTLSGNPGHTNGYILKLDANGDFVWARSFSQGINFNQGPNAITTDQNGNVFATGQFAYTVDFDPGPDTLILTAKGYGYNDAFVMKLNSSGDFEWAKNLGGEKNDLWPKIINDPNGNLYMALTIENDWKSTVDLDPGTGTSAFTLTGTYDCFLLKLNTNGDYIWGKQISGNYSAIRINAFAFDKYANIYMTGDYSFTTDFDPGSNVFNLDSSGGFVSGMDTSGNFIWARRIGTRNLQTGTGLMVNNSGDIYIAGTFFETADVDPGSGVTTLTSNGHIDAYLIKWNASGQLQWAKSYGGTSNDSFPIVTMDSLGNIYITGQFSNEVDFDLESGTYKLTAQAKTDAYIMKLSDNNSTPLHKLISVKATLWPNPTSGIIQFIAPDAYNHKRYEIMNAMGQHVEEKDDWTDDTIDISNLPSGVYIINILLDNQLFNARVVRL